MPASVRHDPKEPLRSISIVTFGHRVRHTQDVKYNIPVELWLPDRYPLEAPMAYVRPTLDMIIKPRHSFVDASGFVRSSYVVNWNPRCAPGAGSCLCSTPPGLTLHTWTTCKICLLADGHKT